MDRVEQIQQMAKRMRLQALHMAYRAGKAGAHLGGGLSCIEILATLYGGCATIDAKNPLWEERDRILIGKAHAVLAYDTALYEMGFLTQEDLDSFEQDGSDLVGHPMRNLQHGIEFSGGSLGMALSVGCGMALDAKVKRRKHRVYVLLGDGECEEGAIWEAMMSAAKMKLHNLTVIIDNNHLQYDGKTEEVGGFTDIEAKLKAFGFLMITCDGHDVNSLLQAFSQKSDDQPIAIIADTIKGKGVSFMENDPLWHHAELKEADYERARAEIEKEM